jgi:bifunctional DNA-binding transcriptional regulator/antitoxin component of YhaV-PrlF toxin-antitoxin module
MKLQKQVSRTYKGKDYHKHWIVLPIEIIEPLKWKEGENLEWSVNKKGELTVRKLE